MSFQSQSLKNVTGIVVEVLLDKAILAFGHGGRQEQALLKKENLTIGGRRVCSESLVDVLPIGTVVNFWCHRVAEMKLEECAWLVTHAIRHDSCTELTVSSDVSTSDMWTAEFMPGLQQMSGTVAEITDRQGVIVSDDGQGGGENLKVFFTAGKLVLFGKLTTQNQKLPELIHEGDDVCFDAIPMHPQENFKSCKWFATLVWQGRRPTVCNTPAIPREAGLKYVLTDGYNLQLMFYQIATDAKAMFLKTEARVMFLINNEFAVAMLQMKQNVMMSALFHRSVCYLSGHNLKNCDLRKFLKEGDIIKFVGVEAPSGLISKFVATQVVICKL